MARRILEGARVDFPELGELLAVPHLDPAGGREILSPDGLWRARAEADLDVVLAVLNLLYMFSKRSNFITRLAPEKRSALLGRLTHLAASWGGKDNGFGLSKCCSDDPITTFPESATTLHFEFYTENKAAADLSASDRKSAFNKGQTVTVINVDQVI